MLRIQEARTADNDVSYKGKTLQIPAHKHRRHFVKAKVRAHEYPEPGDHCWAAMPGPSRAGRAPAQRL